MGGGSPPVAATGDSSSGGASDSSTVGPISINDASGASMGGSPPVAATSVSSSGPASNSPSTDASIAADQWWQTVENNVENNVETTVSDGATTEQVVTCPADMPIQCDDGSCVHEERDCVASPDMNNDGQTGGRVPAEEATSAPPAGSPTPAGSTLGLVVPEGN